MPKHELGQVWNPCRDDKRYQVVLTATGHESPRYVLSFDSERLSDHMTLGAALMRAVGHKACRNGAAIVVNQP